VIGIHRHQIGKLLRIRRVTDLGKLVGAVLRLADLVAMDAYHMIPKAAGLPPSLMVIGMNDRRVVPWMTAKFVARAQAKWPGTVWLRGDDKAGHGVGTTEEVRRSEWADIYAFAWWTQTK
jgi:prolyl oligopeptidase PreP (S9A serine peptidase family)